MNRVGFNQACVAVAAMALSVTTQGQTPVSTPEKPSGQNFEGYDFGQVVEAMETSVHPLQREMDHSFSVFVESVQEADQRRQLRHTRGPWNVYNWIQNLAKKIRGDECVNSENRLL